MAEHPREYLDQLLRCLREAEMAWVADEIEAEITAGRMVEKDVEVGRSVKGLTVEEFDDNERLALALRIVLEHAQVGYAIWLELTKLLHRRLGVQGIKYVDVKSQYEANVDVRAENGVSFQPFSPAFARAVENLADVFGNVASECALRGPDVQRLSARPSSLDWGGE